MQSTITWNCARCSLATIRKIFQNSGRLSMDTNRKRRYYARTGTQGAGMTDNQQGAMTMSTANFNARHIDGMIAQTTNPAEVARLTDLRDRGAEFSKRENRHGETRSGWWLDGVYLGKTTRDAMQVING